MKHIDELRQLPEMIRNLPPAEFDLGHWIYRGPCGTVGCVIGHGITKGILREMSISSKNGDTFSGPNYDGEYSFFAIELYFDISSSDAAYLFCGDKYHCTRKNVGGITVSSFTDRDAVASRIEQFLAEHAPQPILELKPERQRECAIAKRGPT